MSDNAGDEPLRRSWWARSTVLMAIALGVLLVQSALFLAGVGLVSALPYVVVAAQFVAFAVAWWALSRIGRGVGGDGVRLLAYVAGLFIVIGPSLVAGVIDWVWLPVCGDAASAIASDGIGVVDRALSAAIAGLILGAFLSVRTEALRDAAAPRVPSGWSVALVAAMFVFFCNFVSTAYRVYAGFEPWCQRITGSALPSDLGTAVAIVSGFQEELAFTGFALALFVNSPWRTLVTVAVINVLCRLAGHLYYADHHSVWWWLGWVVIWSGGGLVAAVTVGRKALARGMTTTPLVVAYSLGTAVAHSACNLLPVVGRVLTAMILLGVVCIQVGDGSRSWHALWWLELAKARRRTEFDTAQE